MVSSCDVRGILVSEFHFLSSELFRKIRPFAAFLRVSHLRIDAVGGIERSRLIGDERRLHIFAGHSFPINGLEVRMSLDHFGILQTLRLITLQQTAQHACCVRADGFLEKKFFFLKKKHISTKKNPPHRNDELGSHDLLVHDLHVLRVKGRQSSQHFKHKRAKRPPVDSLSVSVAFQHLPNTVREHTTKETNTKHAPQARDTREFRKRWQCDRRQQKVLPWKFQSPSCKCGHHP